MNLLKATKAKRKEEHPPKNLRDVSAVELESIANPYSPVRAVSLSVGSFAIASSFAGDEEDHSDDEKNDKFLVFLDEVSGVNNNAEKFQSPSIINLRTWSLNNDEKDDRLTVTSFSESDSEESFVFHHDEGEKSTTTVFGLRRSPAKANVTSHKPSESILKGMMAHLTEEEKERAAESSYHYMQVREDASKSEQEVRVVRDQAAMEMAQRHWIFSNGHTEAATRSFRRTIRYRVEHRIDLIRSCFSENNLVGGTDEEAADLRRKIRKYMGHGRIVCRGFDKEGRVCLHHLCANVSLASKHDAQGCLDTYFYAFEKAIACTEKRSLDLGLKLGEGPPGVNLSVDFDGFHTWHAPPIHVFKDMMIMLLVHYPDRLHRAYLIDAPRAFRVLWSFIKTFVPASLKAKVRFVTGDEARNRIFDEDFGSVQQTMPYQQPGGQQIRPIDIEEYFNLPFDESFDERP